MQEELRQAGTWTRPQLTKLGKISDVAAGGPPGSQPSTKS